MGCFLRYCNVRRGNEERSSMALAVLSQTSVGMDPTCGPWMASFPVRTIQPSGHGSCGPRSWYEREERCRVLGRSEGAFWGRRIGLSP